MCLGEVIDFCLLEDKSFQIFVYLINLSRTPPLNPLKEELVLPSPLLVKLTVSDEEEKGFYVAWTHILY